MMRRTRSMAIALLLCGLALMSASAAFAQSTTPAPAAPAAAPAPPKIDSGDTAWVLVSTALVLLMTAPGLALFYGGMVRQKNALATLMQSFIILALISLQWVLWGYSLAFGPDKGGIIGGLEWVGLRGVGATPQADYAATIPHTAFMLFQMMFAVITPALVVHISSGASALAAALVIGKRKGYGHQPMPPHNLPLTVMGASLLWFGWFGFNAGSALAANGLAAHAFMTTNTATAAAALGWMFTEWSSRGKPTVLGAASGAVAGLVAITPAAGFVTPMAAIVIGAVAGFICYSACNLKSKLGYDDSLDVVGVHAVGGTWGALATGIFATKLVNDGGGDGLLYGNPRQLWVQFIAVVVTWVLGFVMTTIILKVLDGIMGLRVTDEEEVAGLDLSQHSETAYTLGGGGGYGEARAGH